MNAVITVLVIVSPCFVSPQFIKVSQAINWSGGKSSSLEIKWGDFSVSNGTRMRTANVGYPPTTVNWDADPEKYYVLAMIDPDAPANVFPIFGEIVHWMVVNIRGGNVTTGKELAGYLAPNPPLGSGIHRFVFLVYEQPYLSGLRGRLNYRETFTESIRSRYRFSIRNFANRYNLGDPVAQNYFTAGWLNNPIFGGKSDNVGEIDDFNNTV